MSVVEIIKHYQRSIEKCAGNVERILHCITKLYHLPITVQHLQETGIGRTVNSLRKYDGECGDAAKACVAKWKAVVAAEESSDGETEEQQSIEDTPPVINTKQREEHSSKRQKDDHSSSQQVKDAVKQKNKAENGIVSKSREDRKYSNPIHTEREVNTQKTKVSVDNREKKYKVEVDKADSSSSDSSPKKVKNNSETRKKHKEDKYASSKPRPSSSSSTKEKLEAKENRDARGKKHRDHSEERSPSVSRSNRESKHQSSSSHNKHSEDRSNAKKHREDSSSSSKKVSHKEERAKPKKRVDDEAVGNKTKKRSRVMAEVSDESSDESMELIKLNDKTKNRKNNSSPTFSPFSNSPTADGSIDCLSGASFAEALGMISPVKRRSPNPTHKSSSKSSSLSMGITSKKKPVCSPMEFDFLSTNSPDLKLDASDIEMPDINPNYKPLPNPYNPFDSPPSKKCTMAEDAVLEHLMSKNSTKTQRMKVFSGVKTCGSWKSVPSLFDICVRVLQENIDALEYTGGIPYDILKPVLKHASPDQLFMLEHYNPYLLEDTDSLWSYHTNRHFKTKERLEMETSREMYMRCLDEREAKFNTLRQSIKESQAKSMPVRQTKMAYVDNNYVKPPRNIARQQARNGVSGRIVPKVVPSSSASSAPSRSPAPAPSSSSSGAKQKPRLAPLMQKTMKFAKTFKR